MFGLTTTSRLHAVEAQLTQAYASAELDRRRLERERARERKNLRGRLDRALRAVAAARHELATTNGALHIVSEALVDHQHGLTARTTGSSL